MFCVRILPCLCGFPCGSDFCLNGLLFAFKYTSPLRDISRVCDFSIVDLPKIIPDLVPSISTHPISHKTYKRHTTELSLAWNEFTQGKSKSLVENIISYEASYLPGLSNLKYR